MEGNDVFVQFLSKTFQFLVDLFPKYGWWLAGIIGLTVTLMIPVNILVKKCFAKAENVALIRLRKAISSLMVYAVGIGVLYLYQWLVPVSLRPFVEVEGEWVETVKCFDFIYVAGDIWSIGTLSMAAWWLIKVVGEIGFAPLLLKITGKIKQSNYVKELISKSGVNKDIVNSVLDSVESVLKDRVNDGSMTVEEYMAKNQALITQQATYFLNTYSQIERGQIPETAKIVTEVMNIKHKVNN